MARDIQFAVESDSPLSEKEQEGLNLALEALTPLTNAFQENLSVTKAELSTLIDIADRSDSGITALSLDMSTYDDRHQLSLNKVSGEKELINTKAYVDDFYRLQARGMSSAQYYLRQYDAAFSEAQWEEIVDGSDVQWQRDIISAADQNFEYSTRAWLASNLE